MFQATALTEEANALRAEKKVWEDEAAYLARTSPKDEAPLVLEAQMSSRTWEAKVAPMRTTDAPGACTLRRRLHITWSNIARVIHLRINRHSLAASAAFKPPTSDRHRLRHVQGAAVQAVALEAELRVSKQRLAAAPKNNARAEVELERRADLQFLRGQNDQAWAHGPLQTPALCAAGSGSDVAAASEGVRGDLRGEEASGAAARGIPQG